MIFNMKDKQMPPSNRFVITSLWMRQKKKHWEAKVNPSKIQHQRKKSFARKKDYCLFFGSEFPQLLNPGLMVVLMRGPRGGYFTGLPRKSTARLKLGVHFLSLLPIPWWLPWISYNLDPRHPLSLCLVKPVNCWLGPAVTLWREDTSSNKCIKKTLQQPSPGPSLKEKSLLNKYSSLLAAKPHTTITETAVSAQSVAKLFPDL